MPTHKPHEGILSKRQNIIQAATHLFAEQGFEGTTILQREPGTVNLLIAMINGLIRQRGLHLEEKNGMRDATVEFCRRSFTCLGQTCLPQAGFSRIG